MAKGWRPRRKSELQFIHECILTTFRNMPAGSFRAGAEDRVYELAASRYWLGWYSGKLKSKFIDLIIDDIRKEQV